MKSYAVSTFPHKKRIIALLLVITFISTYPLSVCGCMPSVDKIRLSTENEIADYILDVSALSYAVNDGFAEVSLDIGNVLYALYPTTVDCTIIMGDWIQHSDSLDAYKLFGRDDCAYLLICKNKEWYLGVCLGIFNAGVNNSTILRNIYGISSADDIRTVQIEKSSVDQTVIGQSIEIPTVELTRDQINRFYSFVSKLYTLSEDEYPFELTGCFAYRDTYETGKIYREITIKSTDGVIVHYLYDPYIGSPSYGLKKLSSEDNQWLAEIAWVDFSVGTLDYSGLLVNSQAENCEPDRSNQDTLELIEDQIIRIADWQEAHFFDPQLDTLTMAESYLVYGYGIGGSSIDGHYYAYGKQANEQRVNVMVNQKTYYRLAHVFFQLYGGMVQLYAVEPEDAFAENL